MENQDLKKNSAVQNCQKRAMIVDAGYQPYMGKDAIMDIERHILGNICINKTDQGEYLVNFDFDIPEYEVYIIGELKDCPYDALAKFSIIIESLRRRHASRITLIVPCWNIYGMRSANYVATARSDSSRTITRMLDGCGVDRIVTLTPSPLLRSPLFPIEVIRPDHKDIFQHMLPPEHQNIPLLIMEDPGMFISARELAREASMDIAVNLYQHHQSSVSADVKGRNVILYSEQLESSHILDLEQEVLSRGAASCAIYAPVFGMSHCSMENLVRKVNSTIYTFDDFRHINNFDDRISPLPSDRFIAEWICKDIEERQLVI